MSTLKVNNIASLVDLTFGLGYGQTWQNVTASRAIGAASSNTNNTGKPILVSVTFQLAAATAYGILYVNGMSVGQAGKAGANADQYTLTTVVPNGSTYYVAGTVGLVNWVELR